jgi:HSP20 family protein
MRTRRPGGIGRMPGIARTLSDRARSSRDPQDDLNAAEAAATQLGLGGLFATLRETMERLGQASGGSEKTVEIGGREGRMVFGYSVRMGLDDAAEPFGNVADNGRAPDATAPRQPIIDVYADGADVVVVAELPGVAEADVSVTLEGAALLIFAAGWHKRVKLPAVVIPDSLRHSCRNGILEVRLARLLGESP